MAIDEHLSCFATEDFHDDGVVISDVTTIVIGPTRQISDSGQGLLRRHSLHGSFDIEQTLMDMVRKGGVASLEAWMASAPAVQGGIRAHLSRRFRAENGETLTDFILQEKTEEAKRLLRYSDQSLTAIGL